VFKNRDWFVLGLVGGVALLLAYWDSAVVSAWSARRSPPGSCSKSRCTSFRAGELLDRERPWQLVVAQYLVPGVAVLAAAKLFLSACAGICA
jgi:hypothetical protein